MKRAIPFILFLFLAVIAKSQVFWTEAFENSNTSGALAAGSNTGNGPWTVTDASPALDLCGFPLVPNIWYVSCAENGQASGVCGAGCGSDESLHVGSGTLGDMGASYDAGGWCAYGLGGWGNGTTTDKRVESPTINCVGKSTITINFNYIENGQLAVDNATLWYFNGAIWAQLINLAKTTLCGGQGMWTAYTQLLPASANNNPNVKIGFRWVNDDDGAGTDPSFAVDDIMLSTPIIAPITLLSFTGKQLSASENGLEWITEAEINNNFFTLEHSNNTNEFIAFGTVKGAGNSNTTLFYNFIDEHPFNGINYYRLKQTDFDGKYSYSDIVAVKSNDNNYDINYSNQNLFVSSLIEKNATIEIYDLLGKLIYSKSLLANQIIIPISRDKFNSGIYIIKIGTPENLVIKKIKF